MVDQPFNNNSEDNSQDDKQLKKANQPVAVNSGGQALPGSTQGRVSSFSSGATPTQGSGRFTNIQKYVDANKQASGNLGAKVNQNIDQEFGKQEQQVGQKNAAIQKSFNQGEQDLQTGQGFQSQLGNIQQGFDTGFTDFGNRAGFDTAGQQAVQLAQNQDFGRIASGQAINEQALGTQQQQALLSAQNLRQNAAQNLQSVQTEQGRDKLFSQVLQPKQGYTAGQRSFDKLFLGGALGGITQNLQGKQLTAADLLGRTTGQQGTLQDITNREKMLTEGLTTGATTAQDTFDKVFGDQKNIDFINQLRDKRFQDISGALTSRGALNQEDASLLGLNNLGSTFINDNRPAGTGDFNTQVINDNQLVGTYNLLNDPSNVNKYITRGQNASSVQDITTQDDFNAYKALQQLALGRDTGRIGGISQLGSAVNSTGQLATDIAAADKAFREGAGSKNYQNSSAFQGINVANNQTLAEIGMYNGGNQVGSVGQVGNTATNNADAQSLLNAEIAKAKYFTDVTRPEVVDNGVRGIRYAGDGGATGSGYIDPSSWGAMNYDVGGAGVLAQSNIGDYLKSNNVNRLSETYAVSPSASRNISQAQAASDQAQANLAAQRGEQITADRLKSRLNSIINQEGVRNSLELNQQDPNYRRFKGLV